MLQLIHYHAAVIGRNLDKLRLIGLKGAYCTEIGRAFHKYDVTWVNEKAGTEVQTLLAAGGDENVLCVGMYAVFLRKTLGYLLPEREVALGRAILKRGAAILPQHRRCGFKRVFDREQLRRGHTAGKRNNLRAGGKLE